MTGHPRALRPQLQQAYLLLGRYSTSQESQLWDKSNTPPVLFRHGNPNDTRVNRESGRRAVLSPDKTVHAQNSERSIEESLTQKPSSSSSASSGVIRSSSTQERLKAALQNMTRVRKRKAEAPLEGRSKQRRGNAIDRVKSASGTSSDKQEIQDARQTPQEQQHGVSILPSIKILSESDLPEMPKKLFSAPKETLNNALQKPKGKIVTKFTGSGHRITCILECIIPSLKPLLVNAQHSARASSPCSALFPDNNFVLETRREKCVLSTDCAPPRSGSFRELISSTSQSSQQRDNQGGKGCQD